MKPDFSELPPWVRWLAQDADGSWWGYEHEPNLCDSGWYENEVGRSIRLQKFDPNSDWHLTIQGVKKYNQ